ncbi:DUF6880 family protein [Phenylobacterium sp.]|uniref:DUF6880 family protein n=1 Tax=Phenylobacterium sp. TaxID=1871053 RepID=UPI0028112BD1|nr:DUF6880 family protein [Phenylobacterium sp.]
MKRPTPASLKRVTPENLERLGAARLAELLVEVAGSRPELKRRLRMELAAEQGAEHLLPEIDRRLAAVAKSRGQVSWRQRAAFVRDLDGLRQLIAERLAKLDAAAARDRILRFLGLAGVAQRRVRDVEGAVAAVFERAAGDAGRLLAAGPLSEGAAALASAMAEAPAAWGRWAPAMFAAGGAPLAAAVLPFVRHRTGPPWSQVLRHVADAAGDAELFRDTFKAEELQTPAVAAEVASRLIGARRLEDARAVLEGAVKPGLFRRGRHGRAAPDFAWETAWIAYLEASGQGDAAQEARWASFQRTLSPERARAITARLADFADVEAEQRMFEIAADHPEADAALAFLTAWPALPEAAALVAARIDELTAPPSQLELWAGSLRRRYPAAAQVLLRRAAAQAFRRREFGTSERLTQEADALDR